MTSFLDRLFRGSVWLCGLVGLALPVWIVGFILAHGARALSWNLLVGRPSGFPLGSEGGILPAILGSLALVVLGLAVALPIGLGAGLYLAEFCTSPNVRAWSRAAVEVLAGVPSVLYGLFGYAFFVVFLRMGISLLAGGLVLGLVMLPFILISAQEAFTAVGAQYREATLSLGVDRAAWILGVLLPKARSRILAGLVLAVGHAMGSAAPVLFTASVFYSKGGLAFGQPVMTLPTHLYFLVSEGISLEHAFATALILVAGLFLFNSAAMLLRYYMREL